MAGVSDVRWPGQCVTVGCELPLRGVYSTGQDRPGYSKCALRCTLCPRRCRARRRAAAVTSATSTIPIGGLLVVCSSLQECGSLPLEPLSRLQMNRLHMTGRPRASAPPLPIVRPARAIDLSLGPSSPPTQPSVSPSPFVLLMLAGLQAEALQQPPRANPCLESCAVEISCNHHALIP